MNQVKFTSMTTERLNHYVYALIDPRSNSIFYVGKASANNRAFNHLRPTKSEKAKDLRIAEIRRDKFQPLVEVLRYGLETAEASFEVEAAIIDVIGIENLTNEVRGHGIVRGRQRASDVERLYGSKPFAVEDIREPYMLFFINQTYSPTQTEQQLYDSTRQFWSGVARHTRTPDADGNLPYPVALAVVECAVVRAYSVEAWFKAGSTYSSRPSGAPGNRWEFVGQLLVNHKLVGRRLTKAGKNLPANQQGYGYIN